MARLILMIVFLFSNLAYGQVECPNNVTYPERLKLKTPSNRKVTTRLNGIGLKKVLGFQVFYAGLYLEKLSQSATTILKSKTVKVGVIKTLRSAKRKRLVDFWDKEYERLCGTKCEKLRPFHEKFLSYARDIKKGESLYLIIFKDRFEFEANRNETYPPIKSRDYALLLQRVLIGPDAQDKRLESGLLGKKSVCKKS